MTNSKLYIDSVRSMIAECQQLEDQANNPMNFDIADGIMDQLHDLGEQLNEEMGMLHMSIISELEADFVSDTCLNCDEPYCTHAHNDEPKIFVETTNQDKLRIKYLTKCSNPECGFKFILKEMEL